MCVLNSKTDKPKIKPYQPQINGRPNIAKTTTTIELKQSENTYMLYHSLSCIMQVQQTIVKL